MIKWQTLPGLTQYEDALLKMEHQLEEVISGRGDEVVYLLEHDHVYTAGTNAKDDELKANAPNISVIHVGRGGKYTYHGPGQRVIYPIIDLRKDFRKQDLKLYVRSLEKWIISTLRHFNIECYIIPGKTGIWTDIEIESKDVLLPLGSKIPAKIGAIGVRVRKWVTYHGIAVNISNNLDMYKGIVPCGISDLPVTSMHAVGQKISMNDFDIMLKEEYLKNF